MNSPELHIPATAPWRALLTHAQVHAGFHLKRPVEEYLVNLLVHFVDQDLAPMDMPFQIDEQWIDRVANDCEPSKIALGDQCLLCVGLLPERVIHSGLPVSHFVEIGRGAYRDFSSERGSALHSQLAEDFVPAMDALQTLRAMHSGAIPLDALNAFYLWRDFGSVYGWQVLRELTAALPITNYGPERIH